MYTFIPSVSDIRPFSISPFLGGKKLRRSWPHPSEPRQNRWCPQFWYPENRWWKLIHRVVKSCLERPWFDWYILIPGIAHTQHPLLTTLWLMNGDEWRWLKGTYHRKAPSIYSGKAMQWVDEWKLMNPLKVRSTNHRIGFSTSHPKILDPEHEWDVLGNYLINHTLFEGEQQETNSWLLFFAPNLHPRDKS